MSAGGKFAALVVAVLCASTASALEPDEVMAGLAAVPSSRARFTETRHSTLLKQPLVMSGTLVYQRPDRLEKHVLSPFEESVTIDGSRINVTRRGEAGRTIALPASGPSRALVESLRATLAGDLPALTRHFAVAVSGTRGAWTMTLRPRDAALAAAVMRVEFAGNGSRVQRIEVHEAGGDRSVTTIDDEAR